MIDHLHGRHAMPENIGPVRRLWMMTLLGEPPSTNATKSICNASLTKQVPSKSPGLSRTGRLRKMALWSDTEKYRDLALAAVRH